jgi:hypothetical protein
MPPKAIEDPVQNEVAAAPAARRAVRPRRASHARESQMDVLGRLAVYFVFLYSCVEGLIINIGHPSLLPHLFKDIGIAVVYILIFLPQPARLIPGPVRGLSVALGVFAITVLAYLAIPGPSLAVSMIGLKQRLFYIPLIGIGYHFVRSGRDMQRLILVVALSAVGVAAFGVYLHFTGPDGLRRLGANYATTWLTVPNRGSEAYWRVPGTFTSPGQFGAYLLFTGTMVVGLALTSKAPKLWRIVSGASLTMITMALFTSGSRAPFLLLCVCVCSMVVSSISISRLTAAAITVSLALALGLGYLGSGVKARFESIISYEHVDRFQRTYFGQLFLPDLVENPLGSGLGMATIGSRHFVPLDELKFVESYFGIMAMEMGVPGLIAILWVTAAISFTIIRSWRRMSTSQDATIWLALSNFVLVSMVIFPVSTSIDHSPTNFYFWFAVGALIKLAELQRIRRLSSRRRVRSNGRPKLEPVVAGQLA